MKDSKIIMICVVLLLLLTAVAVLTESSYSNADQNDGHKQWDGFLINEGNNYKPWGNGDEDTWTEISNYEELQNIPDDSDENYYLTGNIIATEGSNFIPIDNFSGTLDGCGYVISGLTINIETENGVENAGLFSTTGDGAVIRNLGLVDSVISAKTTISAGGLIGSASTVTITNSYNTGSVEVDVGTEAYAGGLIGFASTATITNSYNTGSVSADADADAYAGGLIGSASVSATITNSYNTGTVTVTATGEYTEVGAGAGGLIGLASTATITNSYNTGTVTATSEYIDVDAGGLIGFASTATITNSYNTGTVTATGEYADVDTGGLIGFAYNNAEITNSYNTGTVTATGEYASAGGLISLAYFVTITNSYNTGTVTATGEYADAGGLIGDAPVTTIINSYNTGSVEVDVGTEAYAGGLIGYSEAATITITSSYNTGTVTATANGDYAYAGGLIGYVIDSHDHIEIAIIHSYYLKGISERIVGNMDDSEVTSDTDSGSREKKDMKTGDPGRDDIYVDWDFNNIWKLDTDGMVNEGYPYHNITMIMYEVVITSKGDGRTDPSGTQIAEYGSEMTIRFTPLNGNELKEVRVNGTPVSVFGDSITIKITENTTLDVLFGPSSPSPQEQTFYLYVYGEEGGYVYGSGYYSSGTEAIITAIPMSGYRFEQWSDGSTESTRMMTVLSDMMLSAIFSKEGSSSMGSGGPMIGWNVVIVSILIIVAIAVAAIVYSVFRGRRSSS